MINVTELVNDLISHLTFTGAEVEVVESTDEVVINLTLPQEESGVLIGFRGEKIDALQYLLSIIINKDAIHYRPVNLDINSYRQARFDKLKDMADVAAQKAIESGREILLPPLPGNERRIIHLHLSETQAVSTYSEGEGKSRRIIVRPEAANEK
jgi:spoIIIJ-associated protein